MPKTAEDKLLLDVLKRWQKAENASVSLTARIMETSANPTIRLVAEILQGDSLLHHRIEQALVDHADRAAGWRPTDGEFQEVWADLGAAVELEDKLVDFAQASLQQLKGSGDDLRAFLLSYLLAEEKKHKALLAGLRKLRSAT